MPSIVSVSGTLLVCSASYIFSTVLYLALLHLSRSSLSLLSLFVLFPSISLPSLFFCASLSYLFLYPTFYLSFPLFYLHLLPIYFSLFFSLSSYLPSSTLSIPILTPPLLTFSSSSSYLTHNSSPKLYSPTPFHQSFHPHSLSSIHYTSNSRTPTTTLSPHSPSLLTFPLPITYLSLQTLSFLYFLSITYILHLKHTLYFSHYLF